MLARLILLAALVAMLIFVLVSCGSSPTTPASGVDQAPTGTTTPAPTPSPNPTPTPSYLTEVIPPCTPVLGSSVDPCEPGRGPFTTAGGIEAVGIDEPFSLQYFLEGGQSYVPHIALRGTYLPGTIRCSSEYHFRPQAYIADEYGFLIGGPTLHCFADVRVNEYVLGEGPPTLTVEVAHDVFYPYMGGQAEFEEWERRWERILIEGGSIDFDDVSPLPGNEAILFVGPSSNTSVEAWKVYFTWNIERQSNDTVVALHPQIYHYSLEDRNRHSVLAMELPAFKQATTAAQAARVAANDGRTQPAPTYPMLITDVNELDDFFTSIGAYSDPDNPPAQPPAVYACDKDTAVTNPGTNRGLVRDCSALLDGKDTLRGGAALNWGVDTAVTGWDGISTGGTPSRVTKVELSSEGLSGSIPAGAGKIARIDPPGPEPQFPDRKHTSGTGRAGEPGGAAAVGKQSHRVHPPGPQGRGHQRPVLSQPALLPGAAGEPEFRHGRGGQRTPELGRGVQRQQVPGGVPGPRGGLLGRRRRHHHDHVPYGGGAELRAGVQVPGGGLRQRHLLRGGVERVVGGADGDHRRVRNSPLRRVLLLLRNLGAGPPWVRRWARYRLRTPTRTPWPTASRRGTGRGSSPSAGARERSP